jgi:hypothetical protein
MPKKSARDEMLDLRRLALGEHLREPPSGLVRRAIAASAGLLPRPKSALAWVLELVADSASAPVPVGVRAGASRAERRLLYRASPSDPNASTRHVDLLLRRTPTGVDVTGQCLPAPAGARVEITAGRQKKKVPMSEGGEFVVRQLPATARTLTLKLVASDDAALTLSKVPLPDA